ncbi:MAG: hypothetical protein LBK99_10190 [Opitutaceae bacterium]|nr:hypothetical protein [Opitutaceae bacterium]
MINDPRKRAGLSVDYGCILPRLGIEKKSFHSLRHAFATRLKKAGKTEEDIDHLPGHQDVATTREVRSRINNLLHCQSQTLTLPAPMPHNNLFIKVNGTLRLARVSFATDAEAEELVTTWAPVIRGLHGVTVMTDSKKLVDAIDTCEYAEDAASKRRLYQSRGYLVDSWRHLDRQLEADRECEVAGLLVLRCTQPSLDMILGFAFFRRTWANSITIDFLGSHPQYKFAGPPPPAFHVNGVGTALLVCLCRAAARIDAPCIWLEATASSCQFYKRIFGLAEGMDLFTLSQGTYRKLL